MSVRAVLVALGCIALSACNLRTGPPERKDEATIANETAKAEARLAAVSGLQASLLTPTDFGPEFRTVTPTQFNRVQPNPQQVMLRCLTDPKSSPPTDKVALLDSVNRPDVAASASSQVFLRDDLGYSFNVSLLASSDVAATTLATETGDSGTVSKCFVSGLGAGSQGRIEPDTDPHATVVIFDTTASEKGDQVAFNGRIVVLDDGRTISVLVSAQPTTAGPPDPRGLASAVWNRMIAGS
jgi:hypothetical protein